MTVVINGSTGITAPSPFVLEGSTSGTVTVAAPAVAGSNTQTLVAATGTLAPLIADTAKSATSTSVDFTGIPSWVKRVTVLFNGVSTSGTSLVLIQIGSGSVTTSGYLSTSVAANGLIANSTAGFLQAQVMIAAQAYTGQNVITLISSNAYVSSGNFITTNANNGMNNSGSITLSGTLDRVRITTVNGTDTFDAGTINLLWE
jgi:hypothetical protein